MTERNASHTPRGFVVYDDIPTSYGFHEEQRFTIQESSAASGRFVWVGISGIARAHFNVIEATRVRDALTDFIDGVDPVDPATPNGPAQLMVDKIVLESGLPAEVVTRMLRDGWAYHKEIDQPDAWIRTNQYHL